LGYAYDLGRLSTERRSFSRGFLDDYADAYLEAQSTARGTLLSTPGHYAGDPIGQTRRRLLPLSDRAPSARLEDLLRGHYSPAEPVASTEAAVRAFSMFAQTAVAKPFITGDGETASVIDDRLTAESGLCDRWAVPDEFTLPAGEAFAVLDLTRDPDAARRRRVIRRRAYYVDRPWPVRRSPS
jgi:hypothetical protein